LLLNVKKLELSVSTVFSSAFLKKPQQDLVRSELGLYPSVPVPDPNLDPDPLDP
jgi:hypothetical protein